MAVEWDLADDHLLEMARSIIRDHHEHLLEARIAFLYRSEASKSGGKFILGMAKKVSEEMKTLINFDFLIWISKPHFDNLEIDQQRALVDHELCHCGRNINEEWIIRKHDFEEFRAVIQRHGIWNDDLRWANEAFKGAKQPTLIELSTPGGEVATLTGDQLARMSKGQFTRLESDAIQAVKDELLEEAKALVDENGEISISKIQRELRVGYTRAAQLRDLILSARGEKV